jgi:hypothetical protein
LLPAADVVIVFNPAALAAYPAAVLLADAAKQVWNERRAAFPAGLLVIHPGFDCVVVISAGV